MRYSSTLLNQCILGVTLNFDLSIISDRYLHFFFVEIKYVKVLKNALCFIMGYLVAICYVILINAMEIRYFDWCIFV